jgi:hypothetical protein
MTYPLLIPDPPIQVVPELAAIVGFEEAAVLQVLHYWLSPRVNRNLINGRYWVENLPGELAHRFFFWEAETIGYMVARLEQSGILMALSKPASQNSSKGRGEVIYHTINYDLLKGKDRAPTPLFPVLPVSSQNILPFPKGNATTRPSFTAEIRETGGNGYVLGAQDPSHFLACDFTLEIQGNEDKFKIKKTKAAKEKVKLKEVVCHFPRIADDQLKELVWQDDTLYSVIMILFQIKVMQQLLSFCATHHATNLVIFVDRDQADDLEIYGSFLIYRGEFTTADGEKTEMIIAANPEAVGEWHDFMEITNLRLRQILWREQKTNPAIQHYLKSHGLSAF